MPKIEKDINQFAKEHAAKAIDPLLAEDKVIPDRPPSWGVNPVGKQRGPSCGFYALSFICNYWFTRLDAQYQGLSQPLEKPLPPRTNLDPPQKRRTTEERRLKAEGPATSLRQIGKRIGATLIGSLFNAADLLRVAETVGYNGKVVLTEHPGDLVTKVKWYIERNIPVAVPFDAGGSGDPTSSGGGDAHWATVVGYYEEQQAQYIIMQHWLKYYFCEATLLAGSCHQLNSNNQVEFKKVEVKNKQTGNVEKRDFVKTSTLKLNDQTTILSRPGNDKEEYVAMNPEFCEPQALQHDQNKVGLRRKIVPIYPKLTDKPEKEQLIRIFGSDDVAEI